MGNLISNPAKGSIVESIGNGDIGRSIGPERFAVDSVKRSVYLPIVRGAVPEVLQVFDFPDPSIIYGQREVTTVPTQALYMMNSPFVIDQAGQFAGRILAEEKLDDAGKLDLAYRLTLSRSPTADETSTALGFLQEAAESLEEESAARDTAKQKAWATLCQTLFACSEFRYID